MSHDFRNLQIWNNWLAQSFLGQSVLKEEAEHLTSLLRNHYGKHVLLIGVPEQQQLLKSSVIPCHTLMVPPLNHINIDEAVESDMHELPIQSGCVDLVILPHTLEFVDNPRQLLAEACRIVKPEGLIVVTGFNPYGTWGLKKRISNHNSTPWAGNLFSSSQIKGWLRLADFSMENQLATLFRPPVSHSGWYQKLNFIEKIGRACLSPVAGAYILVARAKVIPLTPIKMKWKQKLNDIRISTTFPGHIARFSEVVNLKVSMR